MRAFRCLVFTLVVSLWFVHSLGAQDLETNITTTESVRVLHGLKPRKVHTKPKTARYWPGLYQDRVILKLVDGLELGLTKAHNKNILVGRKIDSLRSKKTASDVQSELNELNLLLHSSDVADFRPLYEQDPNYLRRLRERAEINMKRAHAYIENYFWLYLKSDSLNSAIEFINNLNRLAIVEIAYFAPIPQDADDPPATENFQGNQGYLESAANNGIDAKFAWKRDGGRGAKMKVVDIEAGWNLDHEDLPGPFFTWFRFGSINAPGVDFDNDGSPDNSHGTAVLGELVARDDGRGVTGIVSDAEYAVASVIRPAGIFGHDLSVAEAIIAGLGFLSVGDVLVIEQHAAGPPSPKPCDKCDKDGFVAMEFFPDSFDAIEIATSSGVSVAEAAGNGGQDLDDPAYSGLFDPDVRDSGAILVGASQSTARSPMYFSNRGQRVDVHAWGENVMTTGYGLLRANGDDQNQFYTNAFSGTSSATPIAAGAVLSLQGILKAANRPPLMPIAIRSLLVDTGTPQVDADSAGHIGPMPNLRKAIEEIGITTDSEGGGGGDYFSLECPEGQALLGIKGRSGWYIDQVKAVCGNATEVLSETGAAGGSGGASFTRICPAGSVVTGIVGFAGGFIDSFRLECQMVDGGNPGGTRNLLASVGGSGGTEFGPNRCGGNRIAVGLRGRGAWLIDDLQLLCAEVELADSELESWLSPSAGGSGGSTFKHECDADEVLVGLTARAGWYVDAVRAKCMRVDGNGKWDGDIEHSSWAGGSGGEADALTCPRDFAMTGIRGRAKDWVDRLRIECRRLVSRNEVSGAFQEVDDPAGGTGGEPFGPYRCPANLPGTALRGKAGTYLDSIRLFCGRE